ncbi:MAG: thioredoxin domain-containing protein [Rhodobacteraceae bacterium]|nr:thioredoxin domain-containing protein [Paracoccaceae bacterium]
MQEKPKRRRVLIGAAAVVLGYLGLRGWRAFVSPAIKFEALEHPRGFRMIAGGQVSTGTFGPLIGLGAAGTPEPLRAQAESLVHRDFCAALFGSTDPPPSIVQIASFSDYYCPYCRVLTPLIARLSKEPGTHLSVAWHEYPILGDASRVAARAALAARRQGAYLEFQERMFRASFQPTSAYLSDLCRTIGIDFVQLQVDMASEEVSLDLAESAALARSLGFFGTPDLVVGKTVVQGAVEERVLRRLIGIERQEGLGDLCTIA